MKRGAAKNVSVAIVLLTGVLISWSIFWGGKKSSSRNPIMVLETVLGHVNLSGLKLDVQSHCRGSAWEPYCSFLIRTRSSKDMESFLEQFGFYETAADTLQFEVRLVKSFIKDHGARAKEVHKRVKSELSATGWVLSGLVVSDTELWLFAIGT